MEHRSLFALALLGLLLSTQLRIGVRFWFGTSVPIVPARELVDCASRSRALIGVPPKIALALKSKIDPEFVRIKGKLKKGLI